MTQKINFTVLGNSLPFFKDVVYVRTDDPQKLCSCALEDMQPEYCPNLPVMQRIDLNCSRVVTYERNDQYNQYWGFSGYDEVPDGPEDIDG